MSISTRVMKLSLCLRLLSNKVSYINICEFANKYNNTNLSAKKFYSQNMQIKRIAVCQMTATADKQKNLEIVSKLVEDAAKDNAKMVFLPEACDYVCDNIKDSVNFSEPIIGGETMKRYRDLAKKCNVWLSLGGIHEKDLQNNRKVYNTHVIVNDEGNIVQAYRKLHLFDVDIPDEGIRLMESGYVNGGAEIVTPVETPAGKVGLSICYDVRFPELATKLALLGADVLTYPSAFTYATGKLHWEVLLRSRAIENECFVIAAAQVGNHNAKRRSWGHAMCVDPTGTIIANCKDQEGPLYAIAELDYNVLTKMQKNIPVFKHRRSDVYKILAPCIRTGLLPEHSEKPVKEKVSEEKVVEDNKDDDYQEDCFDFAEIKIRKSTVFYESDLVYAFVNIRCVVSGHVLVAPKRIAKRTEDLTAEEMNDFFQTIVKVQKALEKKYGVKSTTLNIQDGPDAGQTVEHVHCHVMPRQKGDFKETDMIYLELAKHDARPTQGPCLPLKPPRSLKEMRDEAADLRKYF